MTARKKWIAGSLEPKGTLTIDAGAVAALNSGKSLLPAGVIRVDGAFARGDAVVIRGPDGAEVGRGLVAYDAEDAEKIKGRSSADILVDPRLRRPRRDGAPRRSGGRAVLRSDANFLALPRNQGPRPRIAMNFSIDADDHHAQRRTVSLRTAVIVSP